MSPTNGKVNGVTGPVMVPPFPCFSQAAIAQLLHVGRSTVQYWVVNGKLASYQDNIGDRYVLRAELVRFMGEYLQKAIKEE